MENSIINIHLLQLTSVLEAKLQFSANLHKRHSNITFLIRKVLPDAIKITTNQGKHLSKNYATEKRLVEITKETFAQFVGNKRIHVIAIPYSEERQKTLKAIKRNNHA